MKAILTILMAITMSLFSTDQERIVEKITETEKNSEIELNFEFADDIRINTWNKNEVFVRVSVSINKNKDNDAFELELEKQGDNVLVKSKIENIEDLCHKRYVVAEDEDGDNDCTINDCHVELDLNFEVFIPKETSRLNIETINGDVILEDIESEMKIKTISGFIDYTVNQNANLCFNMKTITGEFFTDLDLEIEGSSEDLHHIVGQDLDANLNRGGKSLILETISGNIYLRKR